MILGVLARLSFRDLLRRRWRSGLVGLSVALGSMAALLNGSLIEGIERRLVDDLLIGRSGHLQIRARAGTPGGDASGLVEGPRDVAALAERLLPGCRAAIRHNSTGVVLGDGASTSRTLLVGVQPEAEPEVLQDLRDHAVGPIGRLAVGSVYLGRRVAGRLGAAIGDWITVGAPTSDGDLRAGSFRVAGIVGPRAPWEDYFVYLGVADLHDLVGGENGAQEIQIRLGVEGPALGSARQRLAEGLSAARPDLQVTSYLESGHPLLGAVLASRVQMITLNLVLLAAIALGVASLQILTINERREEIGMMIALGTPRGWVLGRFLMEGVLLALVFGGLGIALGAGVAAVLEGAGIPVPGEALRWAIGGTRLFPHVSASLSLTTLCGVIGVMAVAGLVPAARASGIDPVRALTGAGR